MTSLESTKNKVVAVIPFYNEAGFIEETVKQVLNYADVIIAVDDGSTDNYNITKIKSFKRVILIQHNQNYGKGRALKTGLRKAIEVEGTYTVTIDGDLQHDPEYIPKFIKKMNNCDVAIGNRLHNIKNMPLQRKMSNYITSYLTSVKTGVKILDSQNGYRCIKTKYLPDLLNFNDSWGAETQFIINASRLKLKIGFVNIPTIYNESVSKMQSGKAILSFIKTILFG